MNVPSPLMTAVTMHAAETRLVVSSAPARMALLEMVKHAEVSG